MTTSQRLGVVLLLIGFVLSLVLAGVINPKLVGPKAQTGIEGEGNQEVITILLDVIYQFDKDNPDYWGDVFMETDLYETMDSTLKANNIYIDEEFYLRYHNTRK